MGYELTRNCIDLDHAGDWRGASWEARDVERIIAIHVMPEPGPFDDHHRLLTDMLLDIESRYGVQLKLL